MDPLFVPTCTRVCELSKDRDVISTVVVVVAQVEVFVVLDKGVVIAFFFPVVLNFLVVRLHIHIMMIED
jgi:hypothetical protein